MSATRDARLAAMLAARANWTPDDSPRCSVPRCSRHEHRSGRCEAHWAPLRRLVGAMAGEQTGPTIPRRAFSDAMAQTAISVDEWRDLAYFDLALLHPEDRAEVEALLDRSTDALYTAGYFIGVGPRGGRRLSRKAPVPA